MKTIKTSIALVFMLFAIVGCSDSAVVDSSFNSAAAGKAGNSSAPTPNIVSVASSIDDFNTLVDAVVFADLAGALSARGQFTVFAPTNEAFNDLFQTLGLEPEELLVEANRDLVTDILLYHVVPGRRTSKALGRQVNTLNGAKAQISYSDSPASENSSVFIDSAKIVGPDVTTFDGRRISNGLIHVIDAVILPPDVEAALGISQ